ncbi:bifunctional 2-polyprenyl-6-hydroxyphenol methylase/3-demethylubiquinol 3-O-methyltransferase UbiG [Rickettsiales bacterium]|nr:bifunctional 2-polyprenyl-6-hydroxyphenol methylase/3-demethylubiquinol 3-O-methyltransferase UbiG [Rickettsiales bacterium]
MTNNRTIDPKEVEKFSALADKWWDKDGAFKPLHKFNPVRISYIEDILNKNFKNGAKGIDLIDVGCGGGLLSEPMAKLGANVTGIDASEKNINIAKIHSERSNLSIDYQNISVEDLVKQQKKYDVVMCMEVLEHVANVQQFIAECCQILKPNGILFMATMNRTVKSYALGIIGAEYILRWLPRGTHDWSKFLKPSEIESGLSENNVKLKQIQGVSYNPLSDAWYLSDDISVNYMIMGVKGD